MDDKKKRLLLIVGGSIALVIIGIILFFFVMGGEETPPPPPPVAATPEPEFDESVETAKKMKRVSSVTTTGRETLQSIAARKDVYNDASKWWALFADNPEAVRYLFQADDGTWIAIVPEGTQIKVSEPRELTPAEQLQLRQKFGVWAVQFGSYSESSNADGLIALLGKGEPGMDFYVSDRMIKGTPMHRVRAGLFSRWDDAEAFGRDVEARYEEVHDYYVLRVPGAEMARQNEALRQAYK